MRINPPIRVLADRQVNTNVCVRSADGAASKQRRFSFLSHKLISVQFGVRPYRDVMRNIVKVSIFGIACTQLLLVLALPLTRRVIRIWPEPYFGKTAYYKVLYFFIISVLSKIRFMRADHLTFERSTQASRSASFSTLSSLPHFASSRLLA